MMGYAGENICKRSLWSMRFIFAVTIKLYVAAALWPPRSPMPAILTPAIFITARGRDITLAG